MLNALIMQNLFWDIFPDGALDKFESKPLHGDIKSLFGSMFLRNNPGWLN